MDIIDNEMDVTDKPRLIQKPEDVIVLAAFAYVGYCSVRTSIWLAKDAKSWYINRKDRKKNTEEANA